MTDSSRIAEARALEVPVIISGATTAPGTDKRELFSENAVTTLVFDDGAVLHLRSKLVVDQAIFLHNQQNGREVLCKVREAPAEDSVGHTHLEFTAAAPGFWDASTAQPEAPAEAATPAPPQAPLAPESPADDTLAMMSETAHKIDQSAMTKPGKESGTHPHEELVPAYEMVPQVAVAPTEPSEPPPAEASASPAQPTEPTGEQIDAALRQMSGAAPNASPPAATDASAQSGADPDAEALQNERHLAAMMAREARYAKFAAAKYKGYAEDARDAATLTSEKLGPISNTAAEPEVVVPKVPLGERLASGRNAVIIQIGTCVVIVVSLYFIWGAMKGVFVHPSDRPAVSKAVSKQKTAAPAPARAGTAPKIPPAAQAPPAQAAKVPAATRVDAASAPVANTHAKIEASSTELARAKETPNRDLVSIEPGVDPTARPQSKERRSAEFPTTLVPARILYQPKPIFPSWAKDLDVEGVVTLDAVIDESGNVAETTVISGPRPLQHAAEQAVGLWQFAPAQADGKPVSSHMTLTVEFQR